MLNRRWLAILLAILMLTSLLPVTALAESGAEDAASVYVTGEDTQPDDTEDEDEQQPEEVLPADEQPQEVLPALFAAEGDNAVAAQAVATYATTISGERTITNKNEFPLILQDGADVTLQGPLNIDYRTNPGESPITVAEGASVTITISGTVTLRGANARYENAARAAINVPESATLTILSAHDNRKDDSGNALTAPMDTLNVYGGNAANGRDGTDAGYSVINPSSDSFTWYGGGEGGNGGGGAAAAIGGNGGAGGTGGVNRVAKTPYAYNNAPVVLQKQSDGTWYIDSARQGVASLECYYPIYREAATPGAVGQSAGKISVVGYLTLNGQGGAPAQGGTGGLGEQSRFLSNVTILGLTSNGSLTPVDLYIAGGGGGGGGGGGLAAPFIGSGGAGGAGGGAGGAGGDGYAIFTTTGTLRPEKSKTNVTGGAGGGGGWPNGGGGAGGTGCGIDANTSTSSYGFDTLDNYASVVVALKKAGKDIQFSDITGPVSGGNGGAVGASGANGQDGYPMRYESEGLTHYNDTITTQVGGGGIGAGGRYVTDGGSTGTVGSSGQSGAGKTDPSPWNKDFIISTSVKMPLTGVSSDGVYTDPFIHESYKNSDASDRYSANHTTCFGGGDGYYANGSAPKGKLPHVIYDLRDCYVRYNDSPTYTCEDGICDTTHTYTGGKHTPTLYGRNGLVSSLAYYESNDVGNYLVHNFWFVMSAGGTDTSEWANSVQISNRSDLINCPGKVVIAGVYADYEDMTAHVSEILDALISKGNSHTSSIDKGAQTAKWMIVGSLEKELDIQKATIADFVIGAKGTLDAKDSYMSVLNEDDAYRQYAMVNDVLNLKAGSGFYSSASHTNEDMDTTMWYQSHQYSVKLAELVSQAKTSWTIVGPNSNDYSSVLTGSESTEKTFKTATPGMYAVTLNLSEMTNFNDMTATVYLFIRQQLTAAITGTLHPGCKLTADLGDLPDDVMQKITCVWKHNGTAFEASEGTSNGKTFIPSYSHFGEEVTVTVTYDTSITDQQKSPYISATSGGVMLSHDFGTDATHNGFCHIKLDNGSFCGEYQPPDGPEIYDDEGNWLGVSYEIQNAGQLFYFAALVNGDSTHVHTNTGTLSATPNAVGVLKADIDLLANNPNAENGIAEWTPIGNTVTTWNGNIVKDGGFSGTFDGDGHTVKGMYISKASNVLGFVGHLAPGGQVKNLTVSGSIQLSSSNENGPDTGIGGIVGHASGSASGSATISGVISDVTITGDKLFHVGGIVGCMRGKESTLTKSFYGIPYSDSASLPTITLTESRDSIGGVVGCTEGTIKCCGNLASLISVSSNSTDIFLVGGIAGQAVGHGEILNSFSYSVLEATTSTTNSASGVGLLAGRCTEYTTVTSCVGLTTGNTISTLVGGGNQKGQSDIYGRSAEEFQSGAACYLLNGNTSAENNVWRQNIDNGNGPENYPHLSNTATDDVVFYHRDGTYSNSQEVVSVTIAWGSMDFTYTPGQWNTATLEDSHTWTPSGNTVTVENTGNTAVNAAFEFTPNASFTQYGLTGTLTTSGTSPLAAKSSIEATLGITSRAIPESAFGGKNTKAQIGTVTVTLTVGS